MSRAIPSSQVRRNIPEAVCIGKIALSWAQAVDVINRESNRDKNRQAYHCPICRAWHLGRKPKKIRRS